MNESNFLRWPTVQKMVGVSRATVDRWERAGDFPKRRRLGRNSVAWPRAEIETWCASRPQGAGAPISPEVLKRAHAARRRAG